MLLNIPSALAPRRVTYLGCSLKLRRYGSSTFASARIGSGQRLKRGLVGPLSLRHLSTGSENVSTKEDLLRTPTVIEDIRLKSEFEENGNIRDYLRKWQKVNPNVLDPVGGPEGLNKSQSWAGNMVNDNMNHFDVGGDIARMTGEEMSDFANIADEEEGTHTYLEPGDLVAITSNDEMLRLAIYVRSVFKQQQVYTERGKWRIVHGRDLDFVVKGFVSREAVSCLHPYFPDRLATKTAEMQSSIEGGVPREVGADLLKKMSDFGSQVQELYRANAPRFDHIYDIVAAEEEHLPMTLEELACKALEIEREQLNDVILYAVHRALRQNPFLIENDRSSLFTNHYAIIPARVSAILETVATWAREHQEYLVRAMTGRDVKELKDHPIQKFVQKAQRLIRLNRKVRSPTTVAAIGPTSHRFQAGQDGNPTVYREMLTEKFTFDDRMIIKFLQLWCIPPRRMTSSTLRSTGSHILRATRMYNTMELSSGFAPMFLQEIGVFMPWENLHLLDQDLALPGHGLASSSDSMWSDVQKASKDIRVDDVGDKMKDMRRDWGELPVYCIDDVGAEEIDDGVSLERIPGSDDTFWIRAHIANPTAFISQHDKIIQYAASRMQTLYAPERTYPMFPKSLTQDHFSLASGRPTLTFSAKMNLNGEVLDTDVTNGIVRNVVYLTHDKLRGLFNSGENEFMPPLTVGGQFTNYRSRPGLRDTLSPQDEDTFRTLRQLMLGFREYRRRNGAMDWPLPPETSISVSVGSAPMEPSKIDAQTGRYVLGDPIIQVHPKKLDPHEVPDMTKRYLVSTLMNLACWVSARWCAERNIPAVYDGTYYHPEYPRLTNENISEYGGDGWLKYAPPKGVSSSRPLHHTALGLDAYIKSTSPLRRYTDVLAHYQIEAAIRFEHEHGRRLDGTTSDISALPFTHDDVENYISGTRWKRNRLRICERNSKQYWGCMFLFRAFYFNECELPDSLECIVHMRGDQTSMAGTQLQDGYFGAITSLGLRCHITAPPDLGDINILTVVDAKITGVNVARGLVAMQATRVVKPFKRVGEWA